jgi:transposase-like protein
MRDGTRRRCHDYKDIIYAGTKPEIEVKRKALIRKWRLKCPAVAASLEEAGDKLFTLTRFPKSQWKSIRTSNAIERLHEEFKRRIKTPDRAAFRGNCRDAVLGPAGFWPNHDAQGGRLAKPRREASRSNH